MKISIWVFISKNLLQPKIDKDHPLLQSSQRAPGLNSLEFRVVV